MDYEKAFYLCKAEVEQRNRDIIRCVEEARKLTDSPKVFDLLSSIFHHSHMAVFAFTKCEKEMEQEERPSILTSIAKLKEDTEKLVKEAR